MRRIIYLTYLLVISERKYVYSLQLCTTTTTTAAAVCNLDRYVWIVYSYIILNRRRFQTLWKTRHTECASVIVAGPDRNGITAPPPPETCALVSHMRLGGDRVNRYRGITHIFIPALCYCMCSHDNVRQSSAIRIPHTDSSWRPKIFRRWFMTVRLRPRPIDPNPHDDVIAILLLL